MPYDMNRYIGILVYTNFFNKLMEQNMASSWTSLSSNWFEMFVIFGYWIHILLLIIMFKTTLETIASVMKTIRKVL